MTDIIERAARALARRDSNGPGDESEWPSYTNDVRAVLRAIREPSEGMVEAYLRPKKMKFDGAVATWQAMIDAAMGEE
jgi:hypothetical protein